MDAMTLDSVARLLSSGGTRRGLVRGLVAGAAALGGGGVALHGADAKRRRRRKHKTHRPHASPETCGRQGDGCGALDESGEFTPPYCCHGYSCHYDQDASTWTCQPGTPEM